MSRLDPADFLEETARDPAAVREFELEVFERVVLSPIRDDL